MGRMVGQHNRRRHGGWEMSITDERLKELRDCWQKSSEASVSHDLDPKYSDEQVAIIDQLLSLRRSQWVKVSERLPDGGDDWRDDRCVMVFADSPPPEWSDIDPHSYVIGIDIISIYFLKHGEYRQNITHWRELPSPPMKDSV
jgi:hypothetical protein